jgi:hypothetical protein
MPGWGGLLASLLEKAARGTIHVSNPNSHIRNCREAIKQGEFQLAASLISRLLQPPEIKAEINEQFGIHRLRAANHAARTGMETRLKDFLSLPWQGILTTNYDKIIEYGLQNYATERAVESVDAGLQIGTLLCQPGSDRIFFAKIHGSTDVARVVLSTEEYGETYFRTPRMERFLNAIMLTSTLVFLGCSLEDEIVNLRRRLTSEFEGHIPLAYALMPTNDRNLRRLDWLRSSARIEVVLYDDPTHAAFGRFLTHLRNETQRLAVDPAIGADTAARLTTLPIEERWEELGEINRELIRWIHRLGGSVSHRQLLEIPDADGKEPRRGSKLVRDIAGTERIYRLFFLVSIGCLVERVDGRERAYVLDADMQDYLDRPEKTGARLSRKARTPSA